MGGGGGGGVSPEQHSAGMISSGRGADEHRPAFLAVYPHACLCFFSSRLSRHLSEGHLLQAETHEDKDEGAARRRRRRTVAAAATIWCASVHLFKKNRLKIALQQIARLHTETARNPNRTPIDTRLIIRINLNSPSDESPSEITTFVPFVSKYIQRVFTHDTAVNAALQPTLGCKNLTALKN